MSSSHSVSKFHVSSRLLTTSFPGPSPWTSRRELWEQGCVFRVQNLNAPTEAHSCISLLRRGLFVSQGDEGPLRTYARLLYFDYCYVFLGGVPSGRLCGGERCLSPLVFSPRHDFTPRQSRSLFVPLGAGERRKASPQGTTGRGKRRSFRFSHLPSPRANYFSLLFFRVPVGTLSLLKRAHRGFIVSLPRGHVRKERVAKP